MSGPGRHLTVMKDETLEALAPRAGAAIIDATFGLGGLSCALLEAAPCEVFAIDRDAAADARAKDLAAAFGARFNFLAGRFSAMEALMRAPLAAKGRTGVEGVAFDLGVSSPQIDEADRGFSFLRDGPLDMRMGGDGPTAADLVNRLAEAELAHLLRTYGEERAARAIARAIVRRRTERPITRTLELAELVQRALPKKGHERIHPATRTFQALRIAVNEELEELGLGLAAAESLLLAGGRLAVISFHSLEDRIVKTFLAERAGLKPGVSRHVPEGPPPSPASFRLVTKSPMTPSEAEVADNPRARSAKLRVAERTSAPKFPHEPSRLGLEVGP